MKLKEWAEKTGVKYLTAYRWFKDGTLPVSAYQTESGTIIVQDDSFSSEQHMTGNTQNEAMSLFLKKTVEFSKNNSTVEDFAAYIISNFQIKLNDTPKFVRQKMKDEEVQKHFKQFLPDKEKEEHLKAVKTFIKAQNSSLTEEEKQSLSEAKITASQIQINEPESYCEELNSLSVALTSVDPKSSTVHVYGNAIAEGLVTRSVDLNTTPQQINYTGSINPTFSSSSQITSSAVGLENNTAYNLNTMFPQPATTIVANTLSFTPIQKELESTTRIGNSDSSTLDESTPSPRRRGRPTKKK